MDPRDWFSADAQITLMPLAVVWAVLILAGLIAIFAVWGLIGMIVTNAAGLLRGRHAKERMEYILVDKPIKAVKDVFSWPKRKLDQRRFVSEFEYEPWKFAVNPRQDHIIDAVLYESAKRLQQAFDEQTRLQSSDGPVLKTEMAYVASDIKYYKKEFWGLHKLAGRFTDYHRYRECSYKNHLAR